MSSLFYKLNTDHRSQLCTPFYPWSRASCTHRCTRQTTVQRSMCIPRLSHLHRHRRCDTRRGQDGSRNHSDVGRGHWGPLEAGDRACLHSRHWNNDHKAPSSLRKDQTPTHLDTVSPQQYHPDSRNICHIGSHLQSIHPSPDTGNLIVLKQQTLGPPTPSM